MHIANMKTVHFDCTAHDNREAAKQAFNILGRTEPDVFVFHQPKEVDWDLIRLAYEAGAEVVLTPFPDRYVSPSAR